MLFVADMKRRVVRKQVVRALAPGELEQVTGGVIAPGGGTIRVDRVSEVMINPIYTPHEVAGTNPLFTDGL